MSKVNGYIKNGKTKLQRYSFKYYYQPYSKKESKHQLIYVSLDTNIIIDMVHVLSGTAHNKKSPQYYASLKQLLERSVLSKNQKKKKKGDIVFCVTPTVLKELSNENGEIYNCMKNFINNRTVVLQIDESYQKFFRKKIGKMAEEYYNAGFFRGKNDELTNDAFVTAESLYFNLTLISRDSDISINRHDRNPQRKIEKIKSINRRMLSSDFNGNQAEPRRVNNFCNEVEKCKRQERLMPALENDNCLHIGVQQIIHDINHNQPIREIYGIEKLPNKN